MNKTLERLKIALVLRVMAGAAMLLMGGLVHAEGLLKYGDFSECKKDIYPECRANGGRISLLTEEFTWNRCGKLEISEIRKDPKGHQVAAASVWIGGNAKLGGFPVKPNQLYAFSIEVRGTAPKGGISAVEWVGPQLWKDFQSIKTSVGGFKVQKGWTRYEGTFKTGERAQRAALCLGMWESTQYHPLRLKVGDYLLFDNVSVKEVSLARNMGTKLDAGKSLHATKAICAPVVQAAPRVDGGLDDAAWAASEPMEDFLVLGTDRQAAMKMSARALIHGQDLYLGIRCAEPELPIVHGIVDNGTRIWQDDVLEIFFGSQAKDRFLSQFAIGAGGGRYCSFSQGEIKNYDAWEGKTTVKPGEWCAELRIPLSLIGIQNGVSAGDVLRFNLCRQRKQGKELSTWSRLMQNFHEPDKFGELVIGDYASGLKRKHGIERAMATRTDYEKTVAEVLKKREEARFKSLKEIKFSVAPVSVTSDFSIPFLPEEVFQPVDSILLKAAVNERKPLPLAIANLTDKVAAYRVIVETKDYYLGNYGLKGFPAKQIVMREALRFKDSDEDRGKLRLDPLPRMNEACILTIPPKEAGLVWIDFNTDDVKPGTYEGRIRVIPLSEPATFTSIRGSYHHRKYAGDMKDIDVSLVVRDMVLAKRPQREIGFFQPACNESMFKLMADMGTGNFGLSPWQFQFERNKQGDFDLSKNNKALEGLRATIRNHLDWGKKYGVKPTFLICFSGYRTFQSMHGLSKKPQECARLWPQWLKGVAQIMREAGVDYADYALETWDEPHPRLFPELLESHRLAKQAVPQMRLELTLGAHIMSASDMEKLAPLTDGWVLWSYGYFSDPGHVAFVKKTLAEGKSIRHYTCTTSMRTNLDRNFRRNAWLGERFNMTGNMFFIFSELYLYCGAADFKCSHKGAVAYRSFDGFMPSIRYMALRQGMTDVKYLELLRKVGGNRPEVQAFLEQATRRVVDECSHDATMSDKVREEAAEMIQRLQHK